MKSSRLASFIFQAILSLALSSQTSAGPLILDGNSAKQKTNKLSHDIHWYHVLSQAESAAKQQGKLVFWVQMLGDISGDT